MAELCKMTQTQHCHMHHALCGLFLSGSNGVSIDLLNTTMCIMVQCNKGPKHYHMHCNVCATDCYPAHASLAPTGYKRIGVSDQLTLLTSITSASKVD